jgi:hypothetical protein
MHTIYQLHTPFVILLLVFAVGFVLVHARSTER